MMIQALMMLALTTTPEPKQSLAPYQPCVWPNTCVAEAILPPCPAGTVCRA